MWAALIIRTDNLLTKIVRATAKELSEPRQGENQAER